jgi:hypothetical protein
VVRRGLAFAFACALCCVPSALASGPVQRPPVTWAPPGGQNFTPALHRHITTIVIHVTDGGSLVGNVSWLIDDKSEASAHYVVSRDGHIVQLVPLHDIAWHSGNANVNAHSIGIEHVGETYGPDGFTGDEYRSSARLVAWLTQRYGIPIDRKHIIGHSEVPDPGHPGEFGGSDHHTDPGPHWRWGYYLKLVRRFAHPNALKVATTTLAPDATVTGIVPWRVATTGATASHVDFLIDGRLVWSDARPPFAFAGGRGWNTTQIANGTHVLTVRASGSGEHAAQRLVVNVANREFLVTTSALRPWQKVKGTFRVRANVRGATTTGLGLYVDGHVVSRDRKAPYTMRWNTKRMHDGRHWVTVAAESVDGRVAKRRLPVVVSNHVTRPKPKAKAKPKPAAKPLPPVQITAENLADGQTVSGTVDWRAHTIGPVARVEFAVDGAVIARQTTGAWATAWDSTTVAPGTHVLEVRAYTRAGAKTVRDVTVTVSSPS